MEVGGRRSRPHVQGIRAPFDRPRLQVWDLAPDEEEGRRMTDKLLRERLRIDVLRGSEIHPFEIEEITVKKGDEVTRCYTKPFSDPPVPKKEEQ
jgi:nitrous oxide reductase